MGRKEKINEAKVIFKVELSNMLGDNNKWQQFLDFSSEFYKYSFPENLLMFAQRPNVTMCATLEQWNSVGRWIKKGSKGIRLINNSDNEISLKYVFDVTDTYGDEKVLSRRWKASEQNVVTILKDYFEYEDLSSFDEIVTKYVFEQMGSNELFGKLSEEEQKIILEPEFIECVVKSVTYQVAKRSDIQTRDIEIPNSITNQKTLIILGTAVNKCSNELLRIIEYKIRNLKKEEQSYGIKEIWNDSKKEYGGTISNKIQRVDDRGNDNGQAIGEGTGDNQTEGNNRETSQGEESSTTDKRISSYVEVQSDDRELGRGTVTTNVRREDLEENEEVEQPTSFSLPIENVSEELVMEVLTRIGGVNSLARIKEVLADNGITLKEKIDEIKKECKNMVIEFPFMFRAETTTRGISITDLEKDIKTILSWENVAKRLQRILKIEPVQLSIDSFILTNENIEQDGTNYAIQENLLDYSNEEIAIVDDENKIEKINYKIPDNYVTPYNLKLKYKENVDAIKLLQDIESENRIATAEEQEVLSKYNGWGGLAKVFDENSIEFKEQYKKLKDLLGEDEYKQAKASVLNAFYTDKDIIDTLYKGLERLGFKGGRILEPSARSREFYRKITRKS